MLLNANGKALDGVAVIRSKRRSLSLQVGEDLAVRVRAPRWASENDILRFVESRRQWIEKARHEISRRLEAVQIQADGKLYWRGSLYPFRISSELTERFAFRQDSFLIHPLWANEAGSTAVAWFQKQAAFILEHRLKELSQASKIDYRRFRLGRGRTRWGSCSPRGDISLNWRLVWAPDRIQEYVAVHELCHLRHFNHSRSFWKEVQSFYPGYLEACDWLKEHAALLTWNGFKPVNFEIKQ